VVDIGRLEESWRLVAGHGDQVPLRFYSRLFVAHPEVRDMFPLSMATQRDRFVTALGYTVSQVGQLETITPFLNQLGRDHRKFDVRREHFPLVGEALLATLADFLGEGWTESLRDDWTTAYQLVASVMIDALEDTTTPPWWEAEIVATSTAPSTSPCSPCDPSPPTTTWPGSRCRSRPSCGRGSGATTPPPTRPGPTAPSSCTSGGRPAGRCRARWSTASGWATGCGWAHRGASG
jgi:hemoglobin-like flavoprotein